MHYYTNKFTFYFFYLDLVVQLLKTEDPEEKENINSKLKESSSNVKDLVVNYKKTKVEN